MPPSAIIDVFYFIFTRKIDRQMTGRKERKEGGRGEGKREGRKEASKQVSKEASLIISRALQSTVSTSATTSSFFNIPKKLQKKSLASCCKTIQFILPMED